MTLPSNSSMDVHPNNTVAKFTTVLSQPMELTGEWEVALSEICIPANWFNINSIEHWFKVNGHRFVFPDGFYVNVKSLLEKMTVMIKSVEELDDVEFRVFKQPPNAVKILELLNENKFVIFYVKETSMVAVTMPTSLRISFSPALADILGYEANAVGQYYYYSSGPEVMILSAHKEASLPQNVLLAYVYCDLAQPTIVGDTKVPLLRTVNLDTGAKVVVSHIYTSPIYVPLQKKHFDSVEINIMTDGADPVPFASGRSIVTLHFRRTSNPYFLSR